MTAAAEIARVLGGSEILGAEMNTRLDIARLVRRGLPYASFEELVSALDVSREALSETLHLSPRTRNRRRRDGMLAPVESDRVYTIARVFAHAVDVFEDPGVAAEWMRSPNHALAGNTPLALLDTQAGAEQVDEVLGRLEHGVFG